MYTLTFMTMKFKYCVFTVQAAFSMFVLFHTVPQSSGADATYRALSLAVLGYWFPSPINSVQEK